MAVNIELAAGFDVFGEAENVNVRIPDVVSKASPRLSSIENRADHYLANK
jgi:hypothetical protein